jgi:hypothetical protein
MDREGEGTIGIWKVHFDSHMPSQDQKLFHDAVNRLSHVSNVSMGLWYQAMAAKPVPCFEAVSKWQKVSSAVFPGFEFTNGVLTFNRQVTDKYGFTEEGQVVSAIIPKSESYTSDNMLVFDIAGYLFGFPYEQMLICAGNPEFIGGQAILHYRTKYPDLTVTYNPSRLTLKTP